LHKLYSERERLTPPGTRAAPGGSATRTFAPFPILFPGHKHSGPSVPIAGITVHSAGHYHVEPHEKPKPY